MDPAALRVIQAEHMALSAMLRSLTMLVTQARVRREAPPFEVLRAMLFYIDEFPERLHHPKESTLLFPKVLLRRPELAGTIAALDEDHARGEASARDLRHRLLAYELLISIPHRTYCSRSVPGKGGGRDAPLYQS